jgi:hypothetical protein
LHGYALLSAILTISLLASRLAVIKAFPYTFIVVEIWACRINAFFMTQRIAVTGNSLSFWANQPAQAESSLLADL